MFFLSLFFSPECGQVGSWATWCCCQVEINKENSIFNLCKNVLVLFSDELKVMGAHLSSKGRVCLCCHVCCLLIRQCCCSRKQSGPGDFLCGHTFSRSGSTWTCFFNNNYLLKLILIYSFKYQLSLSNKIHIFY